MPEGMFPVPPPPMHLGIIMDRLRNKYYDRAMDCQLDFERIIDNCKNGNLLQSCEKPKKSANYRLKMALKLNKAVEEKIKKFSEWERKAGTWRLHKVLIDVLIQSILTHVICFII